MSYSKRDTQSNHKTPDRYQEKEPLSDAMEYPPEDPSSSQISWGQKQHWAQQRQFQSEQQQDGTRSLGNQSNGLRRSDQLDSESGRMQRSQEYGSRQGTVSKQGQTMPTTSRGQSASKPLSYFSDAKRKVEEAENKGTYREPNFRKSQMNLDQHHQYKDSPNSVSKRQMLDRPKSKERSPLAFESDNSDFGGTREQFDRSRKLNDDYKTQLQLLEVSLYNESLTNEEQRAYIEVLKQALEAKLNDSGLISFLTTLRNNTRMNEVDLFIELNNVKTLIDHHQQEKFTAEERCKELASQVELFSTENEELKDVIRENKERADETKVDIEKLLSSIDLVEIENRNLNEERASLIEYSNKLRTNFEKSDAENLRLAAEVKAKSSENNELHKKNRDLENSNLEAERKLKMLSRDLEEVRELSSSLEEQIKGLEEESDKINTNCGELKVKFDITNKEKAELERNFADRKRDYDSLHAQYNQLYVGHQELLSENEDTQNRNRDANDRIKDLERQVSTLKEIKEQLEVENTSFSVQIQDLQKKYRDSQREKEELLGLQAESKAYKNEIEQLTLLNEDLKGRLERERQTRTEEIRNLFEQNSDARSELRTLRDEKTAMDVHIKNLDRELEEYRLQLDKKQRSLLTSTRDVSELRKVAEEKQEESENRALQLQQTESDLEELRKINREVQSKLTEMKDARDELEKKVETFKSENWRLRETENKLLERVETLTRTFNETKYENERLTESLASARHESFRMTDEIDRVLGENGKNFPSVPPLSDRVLGVFAPLEEKLKLLLLEKERATSKLSGLTEENERLWKEHQDLLGDYETYYKKNSSLENETDSLHAELEHSRKQCKRQEDQIERFKTELHRMKEDVDRRQEDDTVNIRDKARILEEKAAKYEMEVQILEYLLHKYKEATSNKEIKEVLEEIKAIQLELTRLQKERTALRSEAESSEDRLSSLNSTPAKRKMDSPQRFRETTGIRRKLEEVKDTISTTDSNIDIYNTKKLALEKELNRLITSEKVRATNYFELEKENHQLRTELNMTSKENELLEQTRANLETSYNDLLRELTVLNKRPPKGIVVDDKNNNTSFFQLRDSIAAPITKRTSDFSYTGKYDLNNSNNSVDREKPKSYDSEDQGGESRLQYNKYRKNPLV